MASSDMATAQADSRRDRLAQLAAEFVHFRRWREWILPKGLDVEPAWDLLLILYADKDSVRYSVSTLANAASASFSTALRWVHALKDRGLLILTPDPNHANRMYASLTGRGEQIITSCLRGFETR